MAAFTFATINGKSYYALHILEWCPLCNAKKTYRRGLDFKEVDHSLIRGKTKEIERLEIVYKHLDPQCGRFFIAQFDKYEWEGTDPVQYFKFKAYRPMQPRVRRVSKAVRDMSPMFLKVYTQAAEAEANGLDQIAGLGYRKALEFLVKDWCILVHPSDANEIKKKMLNAVMDAYIGDPRIKSVARRAAWLGNDHAHYERRWMSHDVEDLQKLIWLTVDYIGNELVALKYESEMPG